MVREGVEGLVRCLFVPPAMYREIVDELDESDRRGEGLVGFYWDWCAGTGARDVKEVHWRNIQVSESPRPPAAVYDMNDPVDRQNVRAWLPRHCVDIAASPFLYREKEDLVRSFEAPWLGAVAIGRAAARPPVGPERPHGLFRKVMLPEED